MCDISRGTWQEEDLYFTHYSVYGGGDKSVAFFRPYVVPFVDGWEEGAGGSGIGMGSCKRAGGGINRGNMV